MFFIIQKSMAAKIITSYFITNESENIGKIKYIATTAIFKIIWAREINGWLEAAITGNIGSYYTKLSCNQK